MNLQTLPFYGNALFSTGCAVLLIAAPAQVGRWLGWHHAGLFVLLGVGLLIFAAALVWIARDLRQRQRWARAASIADAAWVVATVPVCLVFADTLAASGLVLLASVAVMVALAGALQWRAVHA